MGLDEGKSEGWSFGGGCGLLDGVRVMFRRWLVSLVAVCGIGGSCKLVMEGVCSSSFILEIVLLMFRKGVEIKARDFTGRDGSNAM